MLIEIHPQIWGADVDYFVVVIELILDQNLSIWGLDDRLALDDLVFEMDVKCFLWNYSKILPYLFRDKLDLGGVSSWFLGDDFEGEQGLGFGRDFKNWMWLISIILDLHILKDDGPMLVSQDLDVNLDVSWLRIQNAENRDINWIEIAYHKPGYSVLKIWNSLRDTNTSLGFGF